ncbi:hypothetical protein, partial [Nioella halotolerans]|uniref:hypothetical protein n=1 Tax=Nioella halotolerans TaxID=2303578 RepID=UPI003F656C12
MNLNKNLRTEQFDIDVDDEVAEFYRGWFDALWEQAERGRDNAAIIKAVYDRYLDDPEEENAPAAARAAPREETTRWHGAAAGLILRNWPKETGDRGRQRSCRECCGNSLAARSGHVRDR